MADEFDPQQVWNADVRLADPTTLLTGLDRFAPRILELRELAARFPEIAALPRFRLIAFIAATAARPLTRLTDDEIVQLIRVAREAPAPPGRMLGVTLLHEDSPPVIFELGVSRVAARTPEEQAIIDLVARGRGRVWAEAHAQLILDGARAVGEL